MKFLSRAFTAFNRHQGAASAKAPEDDISMVQPLKAIPADILATVFGGSEVFANLSGKSERIVVASKKVWSRPLSSRADRLELWRPALTSSAQAPSPWASLPHNFGSR